jgi:hypothetical protein
MKNHDQNIHFIKMVHRKDNLFMTSLVIKNKSFLTVLYSDLNNRDAEEAPQKKKDRNVDIFFFVQKAHLNMVLYNFQDNLHSPGVTLSILVSIFGPNPFGELTSQSTYHTKKLASKSVIHTYILFYKSF